MAILIAISILVYLKASLNDVEVSLRMILDDIPFRRKMREDLRREVSK